MIKDFDRGHWFGASDGRYIFAENQATKSWLEWWAIKCGAENNFRGNVFTKAGNTFEHSVLLKYDPSLTLDRQILIERLRLRVNLDGNTLDGIVECKTHRSDKPFVITEAYMQQAQLQMYAWNNEEMMPHLVDCEGRPPWAKKNKPVDHVTFVSYGLEPDEYLEEYDIKRIEEGTLPINPKRISVHTVKISKSYQRRIPKILKKLSRKLEKEEYRSLKGEELWL